MMPLHLINDNHGKMLTRKPNLLYIQKNKLNSLLRKAEKQD